MLPRLALSLVVLMVSAAGWKAWVSAQPQDGILQVVSKMKAALDGIYDYSCEVDQTYYAGSGEILRYRFKFSFKTGKKIRIDFIDPYSGLTIYYSGGRQDATVVPFPFLSFLKIRLSLENPMIRTPTGQRVDQTDMDYFMEFLMKNLGGSMRAEEEYLEEEEEILFSFRAMDYLEDRQIEKYRIRVSKSHWLPVRIERYSGEGKLVEMSLIGKYLINQGLEDQVFEP